MTATKPSAISSESKALHYSTRIVVVLVAIGAAVLSFDALTALAFASGIRLEFAWIWAVVIDGFILVATFSTFALKDRTGKAKYYAWFTLAVFVIFSILGNAWHAAIVEDNYILPIWVKVTVTAVPPLALFLAIHLLVLMVSPTPEQKMEMKRAKEHADRLNRIREKEIEKIEKQAIINEVKEKSKLHLNSSPSASKPEPAVADKPKIETKIQPAPVIVQTQEDVESREDDIKTEEEVKEMLDKMVADGIALPSGKTVSEWLGKSERTGQNFMKAYKQSLEPQDA